MHPILLLQRAKKWTEGRILEVGRALESLYRTLVADRRWFAATSAAATDYWQKKMYYSNGNCTYNAFLAVIAPFVAISALLGILAQANKTFSADLTRFLKTPSRCLARRQRLH